MNRSTLVILCLLLAFCLLAMASVWRWRRSTPRTRLIAINQRNMERLEWARAQYGLAAPIWLLNEIDHEVACLRHLAGRRKPL